MGLEVGVVPQLTQATSNFDIVSNLTPTPANKWKKKKWKDKKNHILYTT